MSASKSNSPILVWFRRDLRTSDNPALNAAAKSGAPVIPLYILNNKPEPWQPGGASSWWLEGSLTRLDEDLRLINSRLILRRGDPIEILLDLAITTRAQALFFTRLYEPNAVNEEKNVAACFSKNGLDCRRFGGSVLFEPEEIKSKTGKPFKVFTPFYKACLAAVQTEKPLSKPVDLVPPLQWPDSDQLSSWKLRPSAPNWAMGLQRHWSPGSIAAKIRLKAFVANNIAKYDKDRDRPDRQGTSALSPHLHFGEISPREIHYFICCSNRSGRSTTVGSTAFLREIFWREFSQHSLWHWPHIVEFPFKNDFKTFPWRQDNHDLISWKRGMTGYPIVDAGMRQLWETGWMHNRVRMIVASFLTKDLLVSWQEGARWFWDTLVDADLANNTASWQWVAGTGADASPYFRIFNPILQGLKFDPTGDYVRQWVPEISKLSNKFIHTPWKSGECIEAYPEPIVEHRAARQRALQAYHSLKKHSNSL